MKPENLQSLFSGSRLIRTEISTLIGLLIRNEIDHSLPLPGVMQQYLDSTEALLEEMHHAMLKEWAINPEEISKTGFNPFKSGSAMREPLFYGGESAYSFQYRDLSVRKYAADDEWLRANKHFSIQTARDVVHAVSKIHEEKLLALYQIMKEQHPNQWTFLPGHIFTVKEVTERTRIDSDTVRNVLVSLAVPLGERNITFSALHEFNVANVLPLLPSADDTYILFQIYSVVEALYEAPFYWMGADKSYAPVAMQHRGRFTEEFSKERLVSVFGEDAVYSNVDIFKSKSEKVGEIDVLVVFGNRAIVLQAKSKRLTLEAKKGNDGQIKDDFRKSIQDSYDQGYSCAKLLGDPKYELIDSASRRIAIPEVTKEIYILCVIADHYPGLSFQARQFLKFESNKKIPPPFVLDVFTLDAMTEFLDSPLRLLSYIDRRVKYTERLLASHETIILSYHLKKNLWLNKEHDMVMLGDDISIDLDLAMMVRRDGVPGARTPDGILTRVYRTTLGKFIQQIENKPDPGTVDLGFTLLTLNENTIVEVSKLVDRIAAEGRRDGKNHDVTVGLGTANTGLTIHCNNDPLRLSAPRLYAHCKARKYTERTSSWFGICIAPRDTALRFGVNLDYEWKQSDEMDEATRHLRKPRSPVELLQTSIARKKKVGRNDPCPCGSGKKLKKCCGRP